jgi:tRNA pseudouridine55 synthase
MDRTKIPLVFNVYKPPGMSSFQVVYHFKKNLNFDFGKIGHFGTLDPFAEGVLLVGIQGAQKMNDYVHELLPKTYRARGRFGARTESGDFTRPVLETKDIDSSWQTKSREEIEEFLSKIFLGEYWQRPHMISATKFEGKRLYQHALAGRMIEKEKVKREIYTLDILEFNYPYLDFVVSVSSGTYVRSLFEEMAVLMGGHGALETLERLAIGALGVESALKKEEWPMKGNSFSLEQKSIPLDQLLYLDEFVLRGAQTKRYLQGVRLGLCEGNIEKRTNTQLICSENYFWVYHEEGTLLGLGKIVGGELHAIFNLPLSIAQFC